MNYVFSVNHVSVVSKPKGKKTKPKCLTFTYAAVVIVTEDAFRLTSLFLGVQQSEK